MSEVEEEKEEKRVRWSSPLAHLLHGMATKLTDLHVLYGYSTHTGTHLVYLHCVLTVRTPWLPSLKDGLIEHYVYRPLTFTGFFDDRRNTQLPGTKR